MRNKQEKIHKKILLCKSFYQNIILTVGKTYFQDLFKKYFNYLISENAKK